MPNITPHNISLVFDSISDLLQANEGYLKPGMVVQTLGYHTRGDCCPGMFYVMSELGENDVVDGGKVVASGSHTKLLRTNEIYKSLYTKESLNSEDSSI